MKACAILIALALGGCASAPTVPKVVHEVVREYRKLPPELLRPVPKPAPADGTLGALNRSHGARGDVIDLLNCRLQLLAQVNDGGVVDAHACDP